MKTKTALFGHYQVSLRFYLDSYGPLDVVHYDHAVAQAEAQAVQAELANQGHATTLSAPVIDTNTHGIYWRVTIEPKDRMDRKAFAAIETITKARGFRLGK